MKLSRTGFILAALALVKLASAADLEAGRAKAAAVCAACHKADGNSEVGQFPILAGQHPDYLRKALRDYRSGERSNAIMGDQAKTLSDADIENVAAWFSSQKSPLNQDK